MHSDTNLNLCSLFISLMNLCAHKYKNSTRVKKRSFIVILVWSTILKPYARSTVIFGYINLLTGINLFIQMWHLKLLCMKTVDIFSDFIDIIKRNPVDSIINLYWHFTGIGRKNETDYNVCSTLTSYLGHTKPSFHYVRKLFTLINILRIWN